MIFYMREILRVKKIMTGGITSLISTPKRRQVQEARAVGAARMMTVDFRAIVAMKTSHVVGRKFRF